MAILQMNLSATILILAIVIIRALVLYKLPKRTFLALWGVALCRLLIPFSIPSRFSIYSLINTLTAWFSGANMPILEITPFNIAETATGTINPPLSDTPVISISPIMVIWLVGLTLCALFFLVTHLRCRREYKTALPVENELVKGWQRGHLTRRTLEIRQSDRIAAPLTYGIFKPVVILPKIMDWKNETRLRYILTHEFEHIRRFDTLKKLLLAAALCIHWFNPFVWAMYVLANRDIELSCDESVVRKFGETIKTAYALTLIGLEEKRSRLTPLVNNFSKNAIEERIVSIMKIKKTSLVGIILALALVIGTTTIFATNAVASGDNGISSSMRMADNLTAGTKISSSADGEKGDAGTDVVWWTYDEYKAWLEQEKANLQSLVNAPGWSQERVNNAIQRYEQTLEDIKNGARVSKSIKGYDETVGMASNVTNSTDVAAGIASALNPSGSPSVGYTAVVNLENGNTKDFGSFETKEEAFAAVKAFCDEQVKAGKMTQQETDKILSEYK